MKEKKRQVVVMSVAILFSQMAAAQLTEAGEGEKRLVLHTLSATNRTNEQLVTALYFYRSYMSKIVVPFKRMSLYVNDTLIHELKANSVVVYLVYHPGKCKISGDSKDKTSMIVNVKPGGEYFFHC